MVDRLLLNYNPALFIKDDPVSIPHRFRSKADIEISGFLTSVISWGNRKSIIASAARLMEIMDHSPLEFTLNASGKELGKLRHFVHRTFNGDDLRIYLSRLKELYASKGGLESLFNTGKSHEENISRFPDLFLGEFASGRCSKHLGKIAAGSSAKRINMFLRWMVRNDAYGVDFGLWNSVSPAGLFIPLDVHTESSARAIGILTRKQGDWTAVRELTSVLAKFDPEDPVKYDYALFEIGLTGKNHFIHSLSPA